MRPRQTWGQSCPNPECSHYGLLDGDNISSVSTYLTQSGKRRIFRCRACHQMFSETRDTVFFDLRTPEEKVILALKMLLVRVDLTGIAFVLGICEQTVLEWLRRAAAQAQKINEHLLRDLPVTQVQLDELWNFIARKCSVQSPDGKESGPQSTDGRQWVWVSFAPQFRLILSIFIGPRVFESALALIQATAAAIRGIPCFFSDGLNSYLPALIACFHQVRHFPRTGRKGRPRKPIVEPHPDLVYAQVVKDKKNGRLKQITRRVLCGAQRLEQIGLAISTSLLERLNLTLRHALAPLVRKCLNFCKQREQMQRRLVFYQVFYNFARPHQSLQEALPQPRRIKGAVKRKWIARTPAMAAGIADHVWTFRELLTVKIQPRHFQSISP